MKVLGFNVTLPVEVRVDDDAYEKFASDTGTLEKHLCDRMSHHIRRAIKDKHIAAIPYPDGVRRIGVCRFNIQAERVSEEGMVLLQTVLDTVRLSDAAEVLSDLDWYFCSKDDRLYVTTQSCWKTFGGALSWYNVSETINEIHLRYIPVEDRGEAFVEDQQNGK